MYAYSKDGSIIWTKEGYVFKNLVVRVDLISKSSLRGNIKNLYSLFPPQRVA